MSEPESPDDPSARDKRRNHNLRRLIDEMMASIRDAANQELWEPAERAKYEEELAAIMARVRTQATSGASSPQNPPSA